VPTTTQVTEASSEEPNMCSYILGKLFESNILVDDKDSFNQFCVLSMLPKSIMGCDDLTQIGSNYLDSFASHHIDVVDEYFTSTTPDNRLPNKMFSLFCFPKGIKVRLIPRCALEGAERLGLCDGSSDKYEILRFTDESGSTIHGLSITTQEVVSIPNLEKLKQRREERRSARLLARVWREYVFRKANRGIKKKFIGFFRNVKTQLHHEMSFNSFDDEYEPYEENSSSYGISHYVTQQASLSYSTMVENKKLGEICIVESCYVFTGVKDKNLSLIFLALKKSIDSERDIRLTREEKVTRRHELITLFRRKLKFNCW